MLLECCCLPFCHCMCDTSRAQMCAYNYSDICEVTATHGAWEEEQVHAVYTNNGGYKMGGILAQVHLWPTSWAAMKLLWSP